VNHNGEPLNGEEKSVGILIYPDAELLDFCGPFQVFASARLNEEMRRETGSPIRQYLVGESTEPLEVSGGMRMLADADFASCPKLDMLLVPGGGGVRALMHRPEYLEWLKSMAAQVEWLATVGTGSLLLAEAELLVGKSATTLFHSVDLFRERYPRTTLLPELSMVVDGNIITSSSIRAGIEMALYLVAHSYGHPVAREAARQMEYPYPEPPNGRSRNGTAKNGPESKKS
jgi:transcriptional regulator GlxA family with amidase domain